MSAYILVLVNVELGRHVCHCEGKSLDVCALLREKNRLHKPFKRKKAKLVQETVVARSVNLHFICTYQVVLQTGSAASVFDFINYKLGSNIGQPGKDIHAGGDGMANGYYSSCLLGVHPRKHKSKAKGPEGASYFHFDDDIPIKKQKTNDSRGSNLKLEGNLNVKVCCIVLCRYHIDSLIFVQKLVKIQEQLRSLEKRLTSLQQSLDRNMNKY